MPAVAKKPAAVKEQIMQDMASARWRLGLTTGTSIYTIRDENGIPVRFCPKPEQAEVIEEYLAGHLYLLIPKARQIGMSTVIAILCLDALLFSSGIQISLVDQTNDDAKRKLEEKVVYGFEHLDPEFRLQYTVKTKNQEEFRIHLKGTPEGDSVMYAGKRARGGTNQILWISEWCKIQNEPDGKGRSTEILTGAIPSAQKGFKVVESTWKGGRSGDVWPIASEALAKPDNLKSDAEPRIKFFPWYNEAKYVDHGDPRQITNDTLDYFAKLGRLTGYRFSNEQMLWYQLEAGRQRIHMTSEYPSTLDEALESPHEGAFFDAEGVKFQVTQSIMHETSWRPVDIILQGAPGVEFAQWLPKDEKQAPYLMLEPPREGYHYLISCDFCVGKQVEGSSGERDTHAFSVWRAETEDSMGKLLKKRIVCSCRADDRSPTVVAIQRILAMSRLYGDCIVIPEINNKDDIADRLRAAGVRKIWKQGVGQDGAMVGNGRTGDVYGWCTTGNSRTGGSRKRLMDHIEAEVREQSFIAGLGFIAHQLGVFVTDEDGFASAASGERDDFVMMCAIALLNMGAATPYVDPKGKPAAKGGARDFSQFAGDGGRGL